MSGAVMDKKECTKCHKIKSMDEYSHEKKAKGQRRTMCKECANEYAREYRKNYPDKVRNSVHKCTSKNRELFNARGRQWRRNNPEKAKMACRQWYKRRKNKITECLYGGMLQRIRRLSYQNAVIERNKFWHILGYSYEEFIRHIESKFQKGMTWENHGRAWHIDHIIPVSFFHYQSVNDIEFKMCWRLENIQPLWKCKHYLKGSKILVA